jgi:hypothetical protein
MQSTTGSQVVRISGSNAGYTMFQGSVKSTGYPLRSPVSPSLPLPCVTVCHHISTGLFLPSYPTSFNISFCFSYFQHDMNDSPEPKIIPSLLAHIILTPIRFCLRHNPSLPETYKCENRMPTRCNRCILFADPIACSTCFGNHYAHHQDLEIIIQLVAVCGLWCLVFKLSVWCGSELPQAATNCIILSTS